jgi:O-antigen/teichoic acid export membrane protein
VKPEGWRHDEDRLGQRVFRGAGVNFLGLAARALTPVWAIAITRLYGPASFGVYLLAASVVEMAASLSFSGYQDGILAFAASRDASDSKRREDANRIFVNALLFGGLVSVVLAVAGFVLAPRLAPLVFEQPGVGEAIGWMALSAPAILVWRLAVAATKTLMIMRYDALINGLLRPLLLLIGGLALHGMGLTGLLVAFVGTQVLLAAIAAGAFCLHFPPRLLLAEAMRFRCFPALTAFAVPQNLNLALTSFVNDASTIVLAATGAPASTVAFYATGSAVVHNTRQIRLAFSTSFAPAIALLHAGRRKAALERLLARLVRATAGLTVPALIVVLVFRSEILRLFHPTYTADSGFMLVFALVPLLGCSSGLAGNILVMTGHAWWNLANSAVVAAVSAVTSALLIPGLGLTGAACGAAAGMVVLTAVVMIESRKLLDVRTRLLSIYQPYLSGAAAVIVLAFIITVPALSGTFAGRTTATVVALAVHVVILTFLVRSERAPRRPDVENLEQRA